MNTLNAIQQEAVSTTQGPLLVLAGAGSGKTRVVTYRIAHMIEQGICPTTILGLTFTNKAAGEMRERIRSLTNHQVLICTFHALGARILRESISHLGYSSDFTIYDEDDVKKLLKTVLEEVGLKEQKLDLKVIKNMISQTKNHLLEGFAIDEIAEGTLFESCFSSIYAMYQKLLKEYNALDFDDLLFLTERLFKQHPDVLAEYQRRWQYLLIDEYQDTNQTQYSIVNQLVEKTKNLCVVGDPDQSIYSWRGANIQNILTFTKDYPNAKEVRLEQNYRSTETILEAANALISHNTNRFEKDLWSTLGKGSPIYLFSAYNERQEANFIGKMLYKYHYEHQIPYSEMAIFYRTNSQSRLLEDRLLFGRIPYTIVGGLSYYQRKEIKDILAFLRVISSGSDFISFARTINLPKRGIGETTLEHLRKGALIEEMTIFQYVKEVVAENPHVTACRLTKKQKTNLAQYIEMIERLREIAQKETLREIVKQTIDQSGYKEVLMKEKETYEDRLANILELIAKANEWEEMSENPSLSAFLEELSLKSSLDQADSNNVVSLMTLHNGKGLEFRVVFLAGLEEDLFPHANSRSNPQAIEEERRLCYVGMTRAKELLFLSHARTRFLWGTERNQRASRFFKELPITHLKRMDPANLNI